MPGNLSMAVAVRLAGGWERSPGTEEGSDR